MSNEQLASIIMSIICKKICIIGESEVAKNSLISRFGECQFSDKYRSTVGVTISRKTLELPGLKQRDKLKLQLIVWDVTGNPKFKAIAPSYLRGSSGALVVADVSRPETIERIPEHIQLFLSVNPKGFIILILNKSDLIDEKELTKLLQRVQLKDWERVSGVYQNPVTTASSVDEIFQQIAYRSLESI